MIGNAAASTAALPSLSNLFSLAVPSLFFAARLFYLLRRRPVLPALALLFFAGSFPVKALMLMPLVAVASASNEHFNNSRSVALFFRHLHPEFFVLHAPPALPSRR